MQVIGSFLLGAIAGIVAMYMLFADYIQEHVDYLLVQAIAEVELQMPEEMQDVPTNPDGSMSKDFVQIRYNQQKIALQGALEAKKEELLQKGEAMLMSYIQTKVSAIFRADSDKDIIINDITNTDSQIIK